MIKVEITPELLKDHEFQGLVMEALRDFFRESLGGYDDERNRLKQEIKSEMLAKIAPEIGTIFDEVLDTEIVESDWTGRSKPLGVTLRQQIKLEMEKGLLSQDSWNRESVYSKKVKEIVDQALPAHIKQIKEEAINLITQKFVGDAVKKIVVEVFKDVNKAIERGV